MSSHSTADIQNRARPERNPAGLHLLFSDSTRIALRYMILFRRNHPRKYQTLHAYEHFKYCCATVPPQQRYAALLTKLK